MLNISHLHAAQQVVKAGEEGSPLLLTAVGRLCGLGNEEQKALGRGGIPRWLGVVLGIGGGIVVGAMLHRAYPRQMARVIPDLGGRRP